MAERGRRQIEYDEKEARMADEQDFQDRMERFGPPLTDLDVEAKQECERTLAEKENDVSHTPGPWGYDITTQQIVQTETFEAICEMGMVLSEWKPFRNHTDNARLIASAPDLLEENNKQKDLIAELLEACKATIANGPWTGDDHDYCFFCNDNRPGHDPDCKFILLEAAIAKAKELGYDQPTPTNSAASPADETDGPSLEVSDSA